MTMSAFPDSGQLMERLLRDDSLTPEEIHKLLPRIRYLTGEATEALRVRLDAESMLAVSENTETIRKFDQSSRRLNRWLIALTVALVILTGVIAWFTILLALKS